MELINKETFWKKTKIKSLTTQNKNINEDILQ